MRETVLVYRLDNATNQYAAPKSYTFKGNTKVRIYDNLEIDLNKLALV